VLVLLTKVHFWQTSPVEVIPTPGHCPDHVCLFEREKVNLIRSLLQEEL
jgi:glyoxylase-like metal-dependent hydrolase (beta-lactamase superfamily II)